MNKDRPKGNSKQGRGSAREEGGELTNDDLDQIEGRGEALVGKIQERNGRSREAAEEEVDSRMAEQDDH